ncbi:MAG: hypothetical protein KatS3mg003_0688 [Candidatus Nitrosocaldaceae archaeon]|nr:MAG: hypothetical protein KatS3mg003_0688 [Candidatus Nitrosocaldaceae archaeon]
MGDDVLFNKVEDEYEAYIKVEQFIERLHNCEYIIDAKTKDEKKMAEYLGKVLSDYEHAKQLVRVKDEDPLFKFHAKKLELTLNNTVASTTLSGINRVFAYGIIKPNPSFITRCKELEDEVNRLKEENQILRKEIAVREGRLAEYRRRYEGDDYEIGDVE